MHCMRLTVTFWLLAAAKAQKPKEQKPAKQAKVGVSVLQHAWKGSVTSPLQVSIPVCAVAARRR
eukprot:39215-Eustigmatos_ZCMA.PRE.1